MCIRYVNGMFIELYKRKMLGKVSYSTHFTESITNRCKLVFNCKRWPVRMCYFTYFNAVLLWLFAWGTEYPATENGIDGIRFICTHTHIPLLRIIYILLSSFTWRMGADHWAPQWVKIEWADVNGLQVLQYTGDLTLSLLRQGPYN